MPSPWLWGYWERDLPATTNRRIRIGLLVAGPAIWLARWAA